MEFIICTRLYSDKIGAFDSESAANNKTLVTHRAVLSSLIMAPSLLNQTVRTFRHYTITNDKAEKAISNIYRDHLHGCGLQTTLVPKSEWDAVLKQALRQNQDGIGVARIDDDDAIHNDAIRLAISHFRKGKLTVYGYTTGIRVRVGEGFFRKESVTYKTTGHHSILQTFLYDGHTPVIDPYSCDHSNVVSGLFKFGFNHATASQAIVNGDEDVIGPAFIYTRHKDSVSTMNKAKYDVDDRFSQTTVSSEMITARFGVTLDTQKKLLDGTILP